MKLEILSHTNNDCCEARFSDEDGHQSFIAVSGEAMAAAYDAGTEAVWSLLMTALKALEARKGRRPMVGQRMYVPCIVTRIDRTTNPPRVWVCGPVAPEINASNVIEVDWADCKYSDEVR